MKLVKVQQFKKTNEYSSEMVARFLERYSIPQKELTEILILPKTTKQKQANLEQKKVKQNQEKQNQENQGIVGQLNNKFNIIDQQLQQKQNVEKIRQGIQDFTVAQKYAKKTKEKLEIIKAKSLCQKDYEQKLKRISHQRNSNLVDVQKVENLKNFNLRKSQKSNVTKSTFRKIENGQFNKSMNKSLFKLNSIESLKQSYNPYINQLEFSLDQNIDFQFELQANTNRNPQKNSVQNDSNYLSFYKNQSKDDVDENLYNQLKKQKPLQTLADFNKFQIDKAINFNSFDKYEKKNQSHIFNDLSKKSIKYVQYKNFNQFQSESQRLSTNYDQFVMLKKNKLDKYRFFNNQKNNFDNLQNDDNIFANPQKK